jgi:hypothetical protein
MIILVFGRGMIRESVHQTVKTTIRLGRVKNKRRGIFSDFADSSVTPPPTARAFI